MEGTPKWGYPKMAGLQWKIVLEQIIWANPHCRKPPYVHIIYIYMIQIEIQIQIHIYIVLCIYIYTQREREIHNTMCIYIYISARMCVCAHACILHSYLHFMDSQCLVRIWLQLYLILYVHTCVCIFAKIKFIYCMNLSR